MKHGEYTGLAENYSKFRPGYADSVLRALLALTGRAAEALDLVDVGAGTGIFTRMLAAHNPHSICAVEPNADMRNRGIEDSAPTKIQWFEGSGENTGLQDDCADMVSMASSFHWVDFEAGTKEFHRLLREGGRFVALWNPRLIESDPLFVEIEDHLSSLLPDMKRVSSGRSGLTETLTEKLDQSSLFEDVVYIEGRHVSSMTIDDYMGAWHSVNDIRVQLGEQKFAAFIAYVERALIGRDTIDVTYLTRAWSAQRR